MLTITYTSMHSNSSRFRCRLRNAAARFFTSRASRLLKPETSGGIKSLLLIRSPTARGLLVTLGAGLAERLKEAGTAEGLIEIERRCGFGEGREGDGGVGGCEISGKSKTWWVGRQSSLSEPDSELIRILSILVLGMGESILDEPTEFGGDGGRL
jgi:hypothetical protein